MLLSVDFTKITDALASPDFSAIKTALIGLMRALGVDPAYDGFIGGIAAVIAVLMSVGYLSKPKVETTAAAAPPAVAAAATAPPSVTVPPGMMLVPITSAPPASAPSAAAPATVASSSTPPPAPASVDPRSQPGGYVKV